jgi:hypothetical protein
VQVVGVEAEQLRPVEESEGRELLLKGRQGLLDRQLINEIEGGYEVSDELQDPSKTVANPQVVIATYRDGR